VASDSINEIFAVIVGRAGVLAYQAIDPARLRRQQVRAVYHQPAPDRSRVVADQENRCARKRLGDAQAPADVFDVGLFRFP
jgi:hypothetical protein